MLSADLDEVNQPSNPKLNETVHQFLLRQKQLADEREYPPGTIFQCIRCGDCCSYNFYHLNVSDKSLLDKLYMLNKFPNGYWVLTDEGMLCGYMPLWDDPNSKMISFDGPLLQGHIDFLKRTGRRHGYWVLAKETEEMVVYTPVPCLHLIDGDPASCGVYENRPEICKTYSCRRYPLEGKLSPSPAQIE